MAARRPFTPRRSVSAQLPQIRRQAGESQAALAIGRNFERISEITGAFADRATEELSKRRGAEAAREAEGAPELQSPLTLSGESYNAAALDVYRGKLENQARSDVARITRENEHDPAALDQQLDAVLQGYVAEIPDTAPQLKADFSNMFARQKAAAMDRSFRLKGERLESERRAAVSEQIEGRMEGLERIAMSAGVNDEARTQLIDEQKSLESLLLEHGPKGEFRYGDQVFEADDTRSGIYTPEDIQGMLQSAEDRALEARVLGTFRQVDDPAEFRDRFVEDFTDPDTGEFAESPTTGLARQQFEQLKNKMDTELRQMAMDGAVDMQALRDDVRDAQKMLEKGFTPGADRLDSLESRVRAAGDQGLMEDLGRAQDLFQFHQQVSQLRPTELEGAIDGLRAEINAQGGQTNILTFNRLQHAESLLANMRQGIKQDPLGWANRVGLTQLDDLQFTAEDPADALASMRRRRDQGQAVAQYYGTRPRYLTDTEADQLAESFKGADLDQRLALLSNIQQGFAGQSRRVLGQISDDVPVTAHIGGLLALDNDMPVDAHLDVARRALRGQDAISQGNRVLPADVDLQMEIDQVVGSSLSHLSQTRASLISTAEALYTEHALRRGISSELPDTALWERSLHEAAGAIYSDGQRTGGGFGQFNGSQTILPPEISGDGQLDDTLEQLTPDDLAVGSVGGEPPRYGNGETVPPEDIADHARLVPIDVGKYLVDMSDDGTGFIEGSGPDGFYVLDLRGILPRLGERARAPRGTSDLLGPGGGS